MCKHTTFSLSFLWLRGIRLFPASGSRINAINIVKKVSFWYNWASFKYMPKSGNAGFWGRLIPDFLRNCHTHFQSGCTSLHSHQQSDSTSAPTYVSSVVLIITILTGIRWYLRIILIYFSLKTKDFEQFLKCLLAIWESSVEDLLFKSVPHFLTRLLVFWCTVFFSDLYIFWR